MYKTYNIYKCIKHIYKCILNMDNHPSIVHVWIIIQDNRPLKFNIWIIVHIWIIIQDNHPLKFKIWIYFSLIQSKSLNLAMTILKCRRTFFIILATRAQFYIGLAAKAYFYYNISY